MSGGPEKDVVRIIVECVGIIMEFVRIIVECDIIIVEVSEIIRNL